MCEITRGLPCKPPTGSPEGEESQYSRAPVDADLGKYIAMIKAELLACCSVYVTLVHYETQLH
jgi:hypothetical protein